MLLMLIGMIVTGVFIIGCVFHARCSASFAQWGQEDIMRGTGLIYQSAALATLPVYGILNSDPNSFTYALSLIGIVISATVLIFGLVVSMTGLFSKVQ